MLIIIAAQNMQYVLTPLDGSLHRNMANALRNPDDCKSFFLFISYNL